MAIQYRVRELIIALTVFIAAFAFLGTGSSRLISSNPDEKRYIQSAREMVGTGDWLTPRYHEQPRFQKPIMFYWLAALSMALFGDTILAARLPSLLSGALVALLVYLLGKDMYGRRAGLFSACLLSVSWLFFLYSRLATPDMMTLLFISLSLYIFNSIRMARHVTPYLFFAALGLAALTKGFVGLAIPLLVIALYILATKENPILKRFNLFGGVLVVLFLTLPWFILMAVTHGSAYLEHIWRVETLDRVRDVGGIAALFRYIVMGFIVFLPASLLLPPAVIDAVVRRTAKNEEKLLYIWILTVILFFTLFGTKKAHYILLIAPPLAIFLGGYAERHTARRNRLVFFGAFILSAVIMYAALFGFVLPALYKNDGLLLLSDRVRSEIKEGDDIGVGSNFISHNRIAEYLGVGVKKVNKDIRDRKEQIAVSGEILADFLNKENRVFLFIIREDYNDYIGEDMKKGIYLLERGWYWKKPNQLNPGELLSKIAKRDRGGLYRSIMNEVYLISNKKQGAP